ncbi:MAG: flagellar assembly protein FliW [Acidimicrobiia bacterium]
MRVESEQLGVIEVEETKIIRLPDGLLGFPEITRFALIEASDDGTYFWLQALDNPELSFLSLIPWGFFPDYEPEISDADQAVLELDSPEHALVLCLITISDDAVTANLLGPVIINSISGTGRQIVLERTDYSTRAELAQL